MKLIMIHRDYHCCEEDIIATIAVSLGRSFELMYCNAWGFEYKRDDGKSIGQGLFEGENDYFNNMEQYYGIMFRDEGLFTSEDIYTILTESKHNLPIVIYIDNIHCPWRHTNVMNKPHPLLITNVVGDKFYCMDPYYSVENAILHYDAIPESGTRIVTIGVRNVQVILSVFEVCIKNCARKVFSARNATRQLYNDIDNLKCLDNEISLNEGHIVSELLNRLTYLSRRRRQYGEFTYFLSTRGRTKVNELTKSFIFLSNLWNMLCKKLMKIYCTRTWDSQKGDFLALLNATLYQEIILAEQIIKKGSI